MGLSEAQIFGLSTNVQALYVKAKEPLEDGGLDADKVLEELADLHRRAVEANATQEEAKRKAREATEAFLALKDALYRASSSALDMAIGAVGKGTVAAKNFRRLRSDIQRAQTQEEIDAVSVEVQETSP